jgi:hypothetical protein
VLCMSRRHLIQELVPAATQASSPELAVLVPICDSNCVSRGINPIGQAHYKGTCITHTYVL